MGFEFPYFEVTFINDKKCNRLGINRKLAYMANTGQANVGSHIYSFDIVRSDFPALFKAILEDKNYKGFSLKDMVVLPTRIGFKLEHAGDKEEVCLDIALEGTNGKFQVNMGENNFAVLVWTDGVLQKYDRTTCGQTLSMEIVD